MSHTKRSREGFYKDKHPKIKKGKWFDKKSLAKTIRQAFKKKSQVGEEYEHPADKEISKGSKFVRKGNVGTYRQSKFLQRAVTVSRSKNLTQGTNDYGFSVPDSKPLSLGKHRFAVVSKSSDSTSGARVWDLYKKKGGKIRQIGVGKFYKYSTSNGNPSDEHEHQTSYASINKEHRGKRLYPKLLGALRVHYPGKWIPDNSLSPGARKAWKRSTGKHYNSNGEELTRPNPSRRNLRRRNVINPAKRRHDAEQTGKRFWSYKESFILSRIISETDVNDPASRKCKKPDCTGVAPRQKSGFKRGFRRYVCPSCNLGWQERDKKAPALPSEIEKLKKKFNRTQENMLSQLVRENKNSESGRHVYTWSIDCEGQNYIFKSIGGVVSFMNKWAKTADKQSYAYLSVNKIKRIAGQYTPPKPYKPQEAASTKEETISELSKKTLGSYLKKSKYRNDYSPKKSMDKKVERERKYITWSDGKKHEWGNAYRRVSNRIFHNRQRGFTKAVDKLTKEETVNELSRELLDRYKSKAVGQMVSLDQKNRAKGPLAKIFSKEYKNNKSKISKRYKGVDKASKRSLTSKRSRFDTAKSTSFRSNKSWYKENKLNLSKRVLSLV